MADEGALTPKEAAFIATNAYFTLKDWADKAPKAGTESRPTIQDRVTGSGTAGSGAHANTSVGSIRGSQLAGAKLGNVHTARTGISTTSGFGYTMAFEGRGQKHVVIATRGTRPELGATRPDLLTDARAAVTSFGGYGPVHKGFKETFDSLMPNVNRDIAVINRADVVHCVGHSLGGGVATLVAAHFASLGRPVKLYTFGCPRVGALSTYQAFHKKIGKENIYRIAHDLDPITLIGPFPYVHVNPSPSDENNMTMHSPTGKLLSTANHDMVQYINAVGELSWNNVRKRANQVNHDDALLARWLLHEDNNSGWWVQQASVETLSLLFKLFKYQLAAMSTTVILGLSAIDLLAEILMTGTRMIGSLGSQILSLLRYAAQWAGIKIAEGVDFTVEVIKLLLSKMLSALQTIATQAMSALTRNVTPMGVLLAGGYALSAVTAI